jgi:cytochrome P450 family 26 subfamily A
MKMRKEQLGACRNGLEREAVDFFDLVIHELDEPDSELNENTALDLLFLMLFASHETTFIGLTAILKFLTDDPKALQELTVIKLLGPDFRLQIETVVVAFMFLFCVVLEEHENVQKRRVDADSEITWEEYKSMKFTSHVWP